MRAARGLSGRCGPRLGRRSAAAAVIPLWFVMWSVAAVEDRVLLDFCNEDREAPVVHHRIIGYADDIFIVRYDWEKDWWGTFAVVRVEDGVPAHRYLPDLVPSAQCISSVAVRTVNGERFVQVIDRTHMGNGFVYLYRVVDGRLACVVHERVELNSSYERYEPRVATIANEDVDGDGLDDLVIACDHVRFDDIGVETSRTARRSVYIATRSGPFAKVE